MKKLLGMIILLGFILMIGAAGSADVFGMSFVNLLVLEMCGMLVVLFGTSALMHYNAYLTRTRRRRITKRTRVTGVIRMAKRIKMPEKELC